jgi:ATP-dependent Clp endopeptidase proteolytic subunit ClpP
MAYKILNQGKVIEIEIRGDIFPDEEASARQVKAALAQAGSNSIKVPINSDGGSVSEGLEIYHAMMAHPGQVETVCTGCAASMASVIFMAGDKRSIYEGATLMIHNPYGGVIGDADTHEKAAETLREKENFLAKIYSERSGQKIESVLEAMKQETWISAEQAIALGYATHLIPLPKRGKQTGTAALCLGKFKNVPQELLMAVARAKGNSMDPAILEALGLPADATIEQCMAKINAMKEAAAKAAAPPPPATEAAPDTETDPEKAIAKLHPSVQAKVFAWQTKAIKLDASPKSDAVLALIAKNTDKIPPHLEAWAKRQSLEVLTEYLNELGVEESYKTPKETVTVQGSSEALQAVAKATGVPVAKIIEFQAKKVKAL